MIKIVNANEYDTLSLIKSRRTDNGGDISDTVSDIIKNVRARGDGALREYALRFDNCELSEFEVSADDWYSAYRSADPDFEAVLRKAAANIRRYHESARLAGFSDLRSDNTERGMMLMPVARAGIYIPGGSAALSSVALMNIIPASIAKVPEIIAVSPPGKDGKVNPDILAAAKIAGAHRFFAIGGAQAIAALAYGTETVPGVDVIAGPGNAFVTEAKRQVYGQVGIDMLAGPSDITIISDGTVDPRYLAADMLAQAEHDKNATAILITNIGEHAAAVAHAIESQIEDLPRYDIARASIDTNGLIIICDTIDAAMDISNQIAPEHLELAVYNPFLQRLGVKNAGSVFLGGNTPEALGDYYAGPNNTIPTGGASRFASPVSVDVFIKKTQWVYYNNTALREAAQDIALFARREGLEAHARSVLIRQGEEPV